LGQLGKLLDREGFPGLDAPPGRLALNLNFDPQSGKVRILVLIQRIALGVGQQRFTQPGK
jgi:hypothetical protein